LTTHGEAHQTNYVSSPGDHAGEPALPVANTMTSWFFLARVDVMAPELVGAVVALGDSITDGTASSLDENRRWPDRLAQRLAADHHSVAVLNAGIGGNRLLVDNKNDTNALARFDRDVLVQSGVTRLIVYEGTNDIRHTTPPVTVDDLISDSETARSFALVHFRSDDATVVASRVGPSTRHTLRKRAPR
jgi:lysophospholipase L1-like esterase